MQLRALLAQCRQGDELAWEALVRRYQARMHGLAFHYTGDPEEARDLAQEIFVRVYRRLDSCRDPDRFESWLLQIGRNACLDWHRRRKVRPPLQDIPVEDVANLTDGSQSGEAQYEAGARKRLVHRALRTLSEVNREVILLKDIQGLSFDEISKMLEVPIGTVKSRSNRARLALAQRIVEIGQGPAAESSV
jgi:RNA polymerase sigma-70 factor (ECF subfamily)